jgi:major membrane immunogen (membrane-anchored lipoprotein)
VVDVCSYDYVVGYVLDKVLFKRKPAELLANPEVLVNKVLDEVAEVCGSEVVLEVSKILAISMGVVSEVYDVYLKRVRSRLERVAPIYPEYMNMCYKLIRTLESEGYRMVCEDGCVKVKFVRGRKVCLKVDDDGVEVRCEELKNHPAVKEFMDKYVKVVSEDKDKEREYSRIMREEVTEMLKTVAITLDKILDKEAKEVDVVTRRKIIEVVIQKVAAFVFK